ncbi:MAG: peptide-methionine (S)-S-oxide reductase [Psychroserpens sp.]|uniref:peptide-methionine (S)-S-oxide reductase n=1 Tax=Psychroserpens sp. TaxID=2020870 RepID=UPI00300319ED
MSEIKKIGFGGGCHWCTEAVFQSLKGVISVEQGFLASNDEFSSFSEGVIVAFHPEKINLQLLIEIHLLTHKSTKNHSMREKYRSAIYTFSKEQKSQAKLVLNVLNKQNKNEIITLILDFSEFKASGEAFTNYYYNNPEKPFCETFINPKLKLLLEDYSDFVNQDKLSHLNVASTLQ